MKIDQVVLFVKVLPQLMKKFRIDEWIQHIGYHVKISNKIIGSGNNF